MVRRDADSASRPLCWDLPGGNSEWPENLSEPISDLHKNDAIREVFEETKITLNLEDFSHKNLTYFETFFDPNKQIFTVLLGWKIPLTQAPPTIQLSEEHVEAQWLPIEEARKLDFGGKKGSFLPKILES